MDEQIRQALANEILSQLNSLSTLDPGSKEQQTAVENVTKLYRLGLEDVKADTDYDEKLYRRDVDAQHEQEELDRQAREEQFKKDQLAAQAWAYISSRQSLICMERQSKSKTQRKA